MIKPSIVIPIIVAIAALSFFLMRRKADLNGRSQGKIAYDDPSNILFSTPTICDSAPQVEADHKPKAKDFVLHEDNWRQIEFVPRNNFQALTNLVAEIRDFEKTNREQYGWKNTFVRKEYAAPIESLALSFQGLLQSFDPKPESVALYLTSGNFPAKIRDGFSLRINGLGTIYG